MYDQASWNRPDRISSWIFSFVSDSSRGFRPVGKFDVKICNQIHISCGFTVRVLAQNSKTSRHTSLSFILD
mgnify:CR=1 FL=1